MAITLDILPMPQPITVAVPPPQPRPVIAPASERDSANNQRRESSKNQNAPLSFRAALSESTFAGIARSTTTTDTAVWSGVGEERRPREARFPDSAPLEISGDEASDLFTRAVANNERRSRAPEYAAATSRYASSYYAGSPFYARPGDTLEVTV